MAKQTVRELCIKYDCDKAPEIRHSYALKYDELFCGLKDVKKVLEIGVGHPGLMGRHSRARRGNRPYITGSSLRVWQDYFPEAMIYGIDIHPDAFVEGEPRIKTFLGDATNDEFVTKIASEFGPFDIVIDDGSHRQEDATKSAQLLLPYVKKGGMYFIEDLRSPRDVKRRLESWNPEILVNDRRLDKLILIRV